MKQLMFSYKYKNKPLLFFLAVTTLLLSSHAWAENQSKQSISFQSGSWYMGGELRAGILSDTVHNDPTTTVSRTEVFGDDGNNNNEEGSDNTQIPIDLSDSGPIVSSRPLSYDTPEFGTTITGSLIRVGKQGNNYNALLEIGFLSNEQPYSPQLHRLWSEYGIVGIGLGWSTFMDFKGDNYPHTFDYTGPPGSAYARQLGVRVRVAPKWYLGIEEANEDVYLGLNHLNSNNQDNILDKQRISASTEQGEIRTYEVGRELRTRSFIPDLILTYYGEGRKRNLFLSLLLQNIKLDTNSPLFLESDPGLTQIIEDARQRLGLPIIKEVDNQLHLNNDLSGGIQTINAALHLGINGRVARAENTKYTFSYIYNGGRYLRDNPSPSYIAITDIGCLSSDSTSCKYSLANIISHSYLLDFNFRNNYGLIFSGTVTDNSYGVRLGGAATKQVHTIHFNHYKKFADGFSIVNEIGYIYHQTFNTRNNAAYPRFRYAYGINYSF